MNVHPIIVLSGNLAVVVCSIGSAFQYLVVLSVFGFVFCVLGLQQLID